MDSPLEAKLNRNWFAASARIAELEEALRDLIDAATDLDITSYDYNAVLARAESALATEGER